MHTTAFHKSSKANRHQALKHLRQYGCMCACVSNNTGLGIIAVKCLYEEVIVPTALYGAEAGGTRSAVRRKVNALENFGWSVKDA